MLQGPGLSWRGLRAPPTSTAEVRPGVREGAVRIVEETGKPIAQIARDLGVNEGLGNWVARAKGPGGS